MKLLRAVFAGGVALGGTDTEPCRRHTTDEQPLGQHAAEAALRDVFLHDQEATRLPNIVQKFRWRIDRGQLTHQP